MLKKGFILITLFLLVASVFVGCTSTSPKPTSTPKGDNEVANQQNEKVETVYPLTFKDGTDNEVTLEAEPKRIVSLLPSLTESLFAIGAGDKVIAVTIYDNYPLGVQDKVEYVFQDGLNPNIEQILTLNPDLILFGGLNDDITASIRKLAIPSANFDPQNLAGVYQTIERLGLITSTAEEANNLIVSMQEKEQRIRDKVATINEADKVKVWIEVDPSLWTAGKGTYIDELVSIAGGISIVKEQGYPQYSEEKIIAENPQVVLITYGYYVENAVAGVMSREGWQDVAALKNNQVISVDSDTVTRSGPRIIDGLIEIAKAMYPDKFSDF